MPQAHFVVIGGPDDAFCEEIAQTDPQRVVNLAGRTNLSESFYVVFRAEKVVSGDTGFLHAADVFRRSTVALLGPTAFGYPTNNEVVVLVSDLPELRAIVEKYEIGKIVETHQPEKLAVQMMEMVKDTVRFAQWKENLKLAASELCWENEEVKLLEIFKDVL